MRQKYQDLIIDLSTHFICKCCGLSPHRFIEYIFDEKELDEYFKQRVDFLLDVVICLQITHKRGSGTIQKWFCTKNDELGGFSPYQRLKWGWYQNNIIAILDLAKSTT